MVFRRPGEYTRIQKKLLRLHPLRQRKYVKDASICSIEDKGLKNPLAKIAIV